MLFILLGMCVFFWGLGYKLSLYETPTSNIHRVPEAKLVSRNEDSSAIDAVRLCIAKSESLQASDAYTFVLAMFIVSETVLHENLGRRYRSLPRPRCPQFAFQSAFFRRPPPLF